MKKLRHALAQEVGEWEWIWSVERNPAGTGHHVHCHQRGAFVAQSKLSRLAVREGMGPVVDIRRWHRGEEQNTAYGMKAVVYTFKDAAEEVSAAQFLAMNGARLTHQSRGWWTAGGARDQEREAIRDLLGGASDEWHVVRAGDQGRWLAIHGATPRPPLTSATKPPSTPGTSATIPATTSN